MEITIMIPFVLVIFVLGGLAHERDIIRTIRKEGDSNYSTWTKKGIIKGQIID